MREFFRNYKKKLLILLLALGILVGISLLVTLILLLFNIVYLDDGIKFNIALFNSFKNTWYGIIIILIFQVVTTTLLSFAPGTTMGFILMHQALYENVWVSFIMAFVGGTLASFSMYFVGKIGGSKLCRKVLGDEDTNKAFNLLNNKGAIYFPLMILFPLFPDDALIMISGTIKMKLSWFAPSIIIGRGVGIATIIFGLEFIPFYRFTTIWHWIIFGFICLIGTIILFGGAYKLNKYILSKRSIEKD